jgi:hypothetical protein
MSLEAWLLFAATETVLSLSPGPAVLLVLSVSLARGLHSGLRVTAGIPGERSLLFAFGNEPWDDCAHLAGAVLCYQMARCRAIVAAWNVELFSVVTQKGSSSSVAYLIKLSPVSSSG